MKKLKELADYLGKKLEELDVIRQFDLDKITDVEFEGIDYSDAMDFSDAFIVRCNYDGKPATGEQLDYINNNSSYVHEMLMEHLF